MWFKNLRIYRFSKPFELSAEQLEQQLSDFHFTPCGSQDPLKVGFVAPLGEGYDARIHAAGGRQLLCVRRQEKILPGGVVKDILNDRVSQLEEQQGRKLRSKEKQQLKEDIVQELLPRAFTKSSQTYACICPAEGLLLVDTGSASRAEELIGLLRKALGSMPVVPLATRLPIEHSLTQWLKEGDIPAGFELGDEAELREPSEEGGIIRAKRQDLLAEELQNHIAVGKQVTKLALSWREQLDLMLNEDLSLKRLKFADALLETNEEIDREDKAARFDADFVLMLDTVLGLVPALVEVLGGEAEEALG